MAPPIKEYPIKDINGNTVITLKLIDEKSHIFIGDREIMVCRAVPLEIPVELLPKMKEIDSINDILDEWYASQEELENDPRITPELDFFVNNSNLQAWVEHDYDTRLLDYRLSFLLLKELARIGVPRAEMRYKEELLKRYYQGSERIKDFLREYEFFDDITTEEAYNYLLDSTEEQKALLDIIDLFPDDVVGHSQVGVLIPNRVTTEISLGFPGVKKRSGPENLPEILLNLPHLKEITLLHLKIREIPA